jgi:hypothetical protein
VTLMFAELTLKDASFKDPQREFAIELEGITHNPQYSISDTVPFATAANLTYTIRVDDAALDIALLSVSVNQATLSGVIVEHLACGSAAGTAPQGTAAALAPVQGLQETAAPTPTDDKPQSSPELDMSQFSSGVGAAQAQMSSQATEEVVQDVASLGIASTGSCVPPGEPPCCTIMDSWRWCQ